ncbi:PLP-dependent transferase [Marinomonas sp. 2405UD68-3]|uniref:PLP-dependent transferase n=1 Tax=Marinomonas sp. 2405UD68-3 TaxID=3391835 RepID=UPI0039C96E57
MAKILPTSSISMIAFELNTDLFRDAEFINRLTLFSIAVSLGDSEPLIQYSITMMHSPYLQEERLGAGINDGLIRISAGLENSGGLIDDLPQSLEKVETVNHSVSYRKETNKPQQQVA